MSRSIRASWLFEGKPAVLLALMDITERKRAEARLAFMAQHDGLTGLPNRILLRQRLDELLAHTRRSGDKVAVLFLDLDNFKAINDTLGHAIGDKLLKGVTKRLRSSLREEDAIARLGSDEFAVVQAGVSRPEEIAMLARRLIAAISEPYLFDGHSIVSGASIGIAIAPGDGDDAEKLLKNADMGVVACQERGARHLQLLRVRNGRPRAGRAAGLKSICATPSRTACSSRIISR